MKPDYNLIRLIALAISVLSFTTLVNAETIEFDSGVTKNQLIELYTSEGCSSCPPADRWLSALKTESTLWQDLIPIAFHVDYWDRLGWRDRFASPAYSQRQRSYARAYRESTVYTPGVRRNGIEWRAWRRWHVDEDDRDAEQVGVLRLTVEDTGRYTASFAPADPATRGGFRLNLALLGMDLTSQVERGENRGKTLRHDFVVLAKETVANPSMQLLEGTGKSYHWSGKLPNHQITAPEYAVAAWITRVTPEGDNLTTYLDPIQATGGYLSNRPLR